MPLKKEVKLNKPLQILRDGDYKRETSSETRIQRDHLKCKLIFSLVEVFYSIKRFKTLEFQWKVFVLKGSPFLLK
jgi:hypothetical protein